MTATTITAEGADESDSTRTVRDTARGSKNRTNGGTITRLFRETGKALTPRDTDPEPKPQRRRSGDTDAAVFRTAAKTIMRRAARFPVEAYDAAAAFLSDALDWMNPYWQDDSEPDGEFHSIPSNHLSSRL